MSQLLVPDFTPEHELWIDLETFYDTDYTLKRMSTSDYVRDPRFETIGVGVDDGEEQVWMEDAEFRAWARTVPWERVALGSHHSHFDHLILAHHYGIYPGFHLCTMSMARTFGIEEGVSLEALGNHFDVGVKGHEVENAKGKHRRDFTPAEWKRYGEYCKQDCRIARGAYGAMIAQGFPEPELYLIDQTVRMFTRPRLVLDEPLLRQYQVEEAKRKAELLARIGMDRKAVGQNEVLADVFRELGVEPPMKWSTKQQKDIYAFAKNDPGMQELLEHERDEVRWLAEARIAVKSTINETRTERFLKAGANGARLPVGLAYAKAHTYRWAGTDKRNFQNLGRVDPKNPTTTGYLKRSLLAPEGEMVVAADSGAIEARGTAWLAQHTSLLEGFRQNRDLYSEMASEVFGRKVDRKRKPEHELFHPDDAAAGGLGKVAVLGLGFNMGWPKFAVTLLAGPMGNPPVKLTQKDADLMGVNVGKFQADDWKMRRMKKLITRLPESEFLVHCAAADAIVRTYRTIHKPIVDLWGEMETVIEAMEAAEPGQEFSFGPGECLTIVRHGIRLPNGLTLHYPGLRRSEDTLDEDGEVVRGGYSYLKPFGKQRQHLYGGLMTENLVQALARIIIGEQMLSIEAKYGYQIVTVTHDEIVTVVPKSEAELAEHRLIEEMRIAPKWAKGWPLNAEGGHARSYGEC